MASVPGVGRVAGFAGIDLLGYPICALRAARRLLGVARGA